MKKLIALMFCLAVMATVARAEYPGAPKKDVNESVTAQVNMGLRVVDLKIYAADNPTEAYNGKAVIVKFNDDFSKVTLLMDTTLTEGVDLIQQISEAAILGKITNGMIKMADAAALKNFQPIQVKQRNRSEMLLQVTLHVGKLTGNNKHNAQLMKPISSQQAVKALQ